MKVGFVGLGKLGLPVALAVESKGHKVFGYDIKTSSEFPGIKMVSLNILTNSNPTSLTKLKSFSQLSFL